MEREILCRGKSADNGEWVEGYYAALGDVYHYILSGKLTIIKNCPTFEHTLVDVNTIVRYTGLTDKNGKKIFEGDILQCNNNSSDIVKVVFGKFSVIDTETESAVDEVIGWHYEVIPTDALSKIRPFCLSMPLTDCYIDRCNMKIIGNIHDNSELLKGQEK